MRIVGGVLSGRLFSGPKGDGTRPTSERVREAMFSALEARGAVEGATVLDLYAGTAALAFEALSRGAARATSVERDARIVRAIENDARSLGLADRHRALVLDLSRRGAVERLEGPFDLVLADPPWAELGGAVALLSAAPALLLPGGRLVLVHAARDPDPAITGLTMENRYRHGDGAVVLYVRDA